MKVFYFLILILIIFSCKEISPDTTTDIPDNQSQGIKNDSSSLIVKDFREFKVLDSEHITKSQIWELINPQMADFSKEDHDSLKSLILEKDIPSIQNSINNGKLTYEELVKFYLFRIRTFDRENDLSLNSVISINPNAIQLARKADRALASEKQHLIFGMPILLKDNINAEGMITTAGAVALMKNETKDAFLVEQLKSKGAIILGKANLSEWAYFFCGDCPSGYSAVGGQTLNPYGRRIFDTGGSSSGSGVAVAANFCVAAVGSETSGSILSPSSQNSVVGLKPSIGLISRSGIVPISSTLDTAGPMTKNVTDNAILLDAIFGEDKADRKSFITLWEPGFYIDELAKADLAGMRFGAPKRFMEDSLFVNAVLDLRNQGAEVIEIDEPDLKLSNFINLLNLDMRQDLPKYLELYANEDIELRTVSDIVAFNASDSAWIMPYGQRLFRGIMADPGTDEDLQQIRDTLKTIGQRFFNEPMNSLQLDGFLSINNRHAGFAAVAEFPAITVPMGYTELGKPKGLTFISGRLKEKMLLEWAYVYEKATNHRRIPELYQ